jgi:2,3-bisphosphoglycerate-independent phosphoglycerate mutase
MKYLVLVPDGMADRKIPELGGKTPMECAVKPSMDALAARALCGNVSNVPEGMVPESDTANLAILSYDPREYSKGRSPLEAMSLGLSMDPDDTAIRCNVVTLSDDDGTGYENRTMIDHSADEISTEEAEELVRALGHAAPPVVSVLLGAASLKDVQRIAPRR